MSDEIKCIDDMDKLRYHMLNELRGNDLTDEDRIDLCSSYKIIFGDCSTQEDTEWYKKYLDTKELLLQGGYDYSDYFDPMAADVVAQNIRTAFCSFCHDNCKHE